MRCMLNPWHSKDDSCFARAQEIPPTTPAPPSVFVTWICFVNMAGCLLNGVATNSPHGASSRD